MTNFSGQKLAVDPSHGRRSIDVFTKDLTERTRSMATSRPFALFVILAAVILGSYYFLMAAPIYVSEASFSIRGRESPTATSTLLASLGGAVSAGASQSSTDTAELQTYVESYDMATKLDEEFHLRDAYAQWHRLDFLNHLSKDASRDDYLDYYRKMVHVSIDHDTGLINVRVRAFDPKTAQLMASAVLRISADYLNGLSATVRRDTLRTSELELQEAENKVRQARMAINNYRAATGSLDPAAAAMATSAGISGMQQQVIQLKADQAAQLAFNRPGSPQMAESQARIKGLEEQIAVQQQKIANTSGRDNVTERLRAFEGLQISNEYADRNLVAALSAYDAARSVASERERFVVPAVAPNLPDEATEPHRLTSFLEAMLVLIAVYGIVALAIAGVRDHQGNLNHMRIIALASALLLLGASPALAQSNLTPPVATQNNTVATAGTSAAVSAVSAVRAGQQASGAPGTAANPLAGATAGVVSLSSPTAQSQYQAPVVVLTLSDMVPVPLYGTQLFTGAFSGTRPADRPDYNIQPGDQVVVNLYGAVNSGGNETVDALGNIFIVGIGPIHVGGIPATALQGVITAAVGRVFTSAVSVYTAISNAGSIGVFISGDVTRPGRYLGGTHDSILYYLNQAQGVSGNGTYRAVTVKRAGQVVATYDLYDFLQSGDVPSFRFQEGDTIFVGPRGSIVGVTGSADFPDAFEAPANRPMTGADIIRLSRPDSSITGVVVRGYRNGAPKEAFFTLGDFARVVLADGDHVSLSTSGYRDTVTVMIRGDVQGPTAYVLPRGAELSQLLAKIPLQGTAIEPKWVHLERPAVALEQKQAITDELFRIQKAVLTSSPPTNSAAQLATAQATLVNQFVNQAQTVTPTGNVAVYTNGEFHDVMLEDGDTVVLPNRTDVILVSGEVESASALVQVAGMDVEGYVNRAGGYAAHANKKRFVLLHPNGSGQVAGPHDKPQPGDQVLVLPNVGNENLQVFMDLSQLFFQLALSAATVISVSHSL